MNTNLHPPQHTTRREALKAGAAIAVGVTAATYVQPTLRSIGIPSALAATSGSQGPSCGSCTIGLSFGTVNSQHVRSSNTTNFTGTGTITQRSDDTTCKVASAVLYLVSGSLAGGCGKYDPTTQPPIAQFVTTDNSGGGTPLTAGFPVPNPNGAKATFTVNVSARGNLVGKVVLALYVTVNDQCQHQSGFNFQTCIAVAC